MSTHQLAQSIAFSFQQCRDDETKILLQAVLDGMIQRFNRIGGEGIYDITAASIMLQVVADQLDQAAASAREEGVEGGYRALSDAASSVERIVRELAPFTED